MPDDSINVETLAHIDAIYTASYYRRLRAMETAYINYSPRKSSRIARLPSPKSSASIGDTIRNTQTTTQESFTSVPDNANSSYLYIREPSHSSFEGVEFPILRSSHGLSPDLSSKGMVTYTQYISPTEIPQCDSSEQKHDYISSPDVPWPQFNQEATSPTRYPTGVTRSPLPSVREAIEVPYTPFQKRRWSLLQPSHQVNEYQYPSKRHAIESVRLEGKDEIIKETPIARSKMARGLAVDKKTPSSGSRALKFKGGKAQCTPDHTPNYHTPKKPTSPRSATRSPHPITKFYRSHGYTYDSLDVRPPEPPVGDLAIVPEDLVPPMLAKLAKVLSIPKRFRAESCAREIIPFERGFWQLDCSGWDDRLRAEGWAFLTNYVASGAAGWGVRSVRDEDFRWIRVYCWGHVVPHIYLLLYLASQRHILATGSSWYDGAGEEVIVTRKLARL